MLSVTEAIALIDEYEQRNNERVANLIRQGANIDAGLLANIRVLALAEFMYGKRDGEVVTPVERKVEDNERLSFELYMHEKFDEAISGFETQVRRAILTQNVNQVMTHNGTKRH